MRLEGPNPKDALQQLVPSDLHRIGPGEASYTVLLNETGGIRDDLIVYDCGALDDEPRCPGAGDQRRLRRCRHRLDS